MCGAWKGGRGRVKGEGEGGGVAKGDGGKRECMIMVIVLGCRRSFCLKDLKDSF